MSYKWVKIKFGSFLKRYKKHKKLNMMQRSFMKGHYLVHQVKRGRKIISTERVSLYPRRFRKKHRR